jgi:hypothetical protein
MATTITNVNDIQDEFKSTLTLEIYLSDHKNILYLPISSKKICQSWTSYTEIPPFFAV